jgi:hypothetical protein
VRPNVAIEQAIRTGVEHSLVEQALLNSRSRQLLALNRTGLDGGRFQWVSATFL